MPCATELTPTTTSNTLEDSMVLTAEKPVSQQDDRMIADAWTDNADRLATWCLGHLVNRKDAYGSYYRGSDGKIRSCKSDGTVDTNLLVRHFRSREIIGLYSTSLEDMCRWLMIDIDRHDPDPESVAEAADRFAHEIYEDLRSLGFGPLLIDSNGKGGRHIAVIFEEPVPASKVRSFGRFLVRNWETAGFSTEPEVFPKQDSIRKSDGTVGYGNFVRLLGKHPKRDHYSRIWNGEVWLSGDAAIELVLSKSGDSPELLPAESESFPHGQRA
jgi:putative DNA primase/helicase